MQGAPPPARKPDASMPTTRYPGAHQVMQDTIKELTVTDHASPTAGVRKLPKTRISHPTRQTPRKGPVKKPSDA